MPLNNSFQAIVELLQSYWSELSCAVLTPYDAEMGAGTFHPATVLQALGPKPWRCTYVQPSRRPTDSRFGIHPNRLHRHHQLQVLLKPAPSDVQNLYLNSLRRIGIDTSRHDIRFVEDDWESPTLGASGLGWEVWCDGMEVTQFTYIQKMGGLECEVVSCEITYGLERLIMYVQDKDNVYDLDYNQYQDKNLRISYGDVFQRTEAELSEYAMNLANTDMLLQHFKDLEAESLSLIARRLAVPAYELCMKCSHIFNLLDARGVIGTTERARYIARVRNLARGACNIWLGHEPQLEDLSFEEDEDNEN